MPASRPLLLALAGAAAGGALLGGAALVLLPASPSAVEVRFPAASAAPADGRLMVYVAGAVVRPGVYPFNPGDRVADAIAAAGGPSEDADTTAVNFARRLKDEDQVTVPRQGEVPAPGTVRGSAASAAPAGRRVEINTANAAVLEALPGIGTARAQRIIESRQKEGPFREPADLVRRKILPQSVLDGLIELIDVRP